MQRRSLGGHALLNITGKSRINYFQLLVRYQHHQQQQQEESGRRNR